LELSLTTGWDEWHFKVEKMKTRLFSFEPLKMLAVLQYFANGQSLLRLKLSESGNFVNGLLWDAAG
jgi:hypothetical protein